GEAGIEGVHVTICQVCDGTDNVSTDTGPTGVFEFTNVFGPTKVAVLIPTGSQASPPNVGSDDTIDSDGVPNGAGFSVATSGGDFTSTDFGFFTPTATQPGTGTPGYWKNHPEAWPVSSIVVGGVTYSTGQAITVLQNVGKDRTTAMFAAL